MSRENIQKMVLAAMFLAAGLILPQLIGHVQVLGTALLPMHLPVLLAGVILGPRYGGLVGLLLPFLRHIIAGMPPLFIANSMMFELAIYGVVIGVLYAKLPKNLLGLFISLLAAMVAGRVVYAVVFSLLVGMPDEPISYFATALVVSSWVGIALQLVLVPTITLALRRARLIE